MSALRPRVYRFANPQTWRRCVLHRFDVDFDGSLVAMPRLGRRAIREIDDVEVSAVSIDPAGGLLWRRGLQPPKGEIAARWLNVFGEPATPFVLGGPLAHSPRWIVDRRWLWAFEPRSTHVLRYDSETLDLDRTIDVASFRFPEGRAVSFKAVLDLATDGAEGVWALVRAERGVDWLVHVDCHGRLRTARRVPLDCGLIQQIATTGRGSTLVLLPENPATLCFLAPDDELSARSLVLSGIGAEWARLRLTSDGRDRIALFGVEATGVKPHWALVVFDGGGDLIDGPRHDLFAGSDSPTPGNEKGSPASPRRDVAIRGDDVWFAMQDGLWHLGPGASHGVQESTSALMTPLLVSPPSSFERGWLRAELAIDLPRGAVLEADFRCTDDRARAAEVERVLADGRLTNEKRHDRVWELLEPLPRSRVVLAGPTSRSTPLTVPLFECTRSWLVLRLRISTPPEADRPRLAELRILYPDVSIAQNLPAIVRGEEGDPTGFLRRLVGVIESTTQRIDERIQSIGRAIDPATAPPEWLDYLARWLELPWDEALPETAKCCLVKHAGEILAQRGTRAGLSLLLRCVVGDGGVVIRDPAVDHPPIRLGGGDRRGSTLPAVLAGISSRVPVLGSGAALGRARLGCNCNRDPLRGLVARLRLALTVSRTTRRTLEPLLSGLLAHYLPAGLVVAIAWREQPPHSPGSIEDGFVVVADGPGILDDDSVLGRTVLTGRDRGRIRNDGIRLGFRLH